METGKYCTGGVICRVLLVIGGLNWGLVGLGNFLDRDLNVVNALLGSWPSVEWIVYLLVGLSALWTVVSWNKCCGSMCSASK